MKYFTFLDVELSVKPCHSSFDEVLEEIDMLAVISLGRVVRPYRCIVEDVPLLEIAHLGIADQQYLPVKAKVSFVVNTILSVQGP